MLARIGILTALHRHEVREFKTSQKKTHWGKRKLGARPLTRQLASLDRKSVGNATTVPPMP